jgi:hypothetical protein
MCAFVVVPFHVSNDVGWTILVQGVLEEVLDLTVDLRRSSRRHLFEIVTAVLDALVTAVRF